MLSIHKILCNFVNLFLVRLNKKEKQIKSIQINNAETPLEESIFTNSNENQ